MRAGKEDSRPKLVLASASPRRNQLLVLLGLPFTVCPADVDETNHAVEGPASMVMRLAQAKARVANAQVPGGLIVAADTLVYLHGQVLGKPADAQQAMDMLRRLRGRAHIVFSAVTMIDGRSGLERTRLAVTWVWMREYSDGQLTAYVASGDPMDKAGAYAIQYPGFAPVSRVEGCHANVMGLPLCHLYRMLAEIELAPVDAPVAACDHYNRRRCDVADRILGDSHHDIRH
jgi:MAF protein